MRGGPENYCPEGSRVPREWGSGGRAEGVISRQRVSWKEVTLQRTVS